jgi:hypothetical protein
MAASYAAKPQASTARVLRFIDLTVTRLFGDIKKAQVMRQGWILGSSPSKTNKGGG